MGRQPLAFSCRGSAHYLCPKLLQIVGAVLYRSAAGRNNRAGSLTGGAACRGVGVDWRPSSRMGSPAPDHHKQHVGMWGLTQPIPQSRHVNPTANPDCSLCRHSGCHRARVGLQFLIRIAYTLTAARCGRWRACVVVAAHQLRTSHTPCTTASGAITRAHAKAPTEGNRTGTLLRGGGMRDHAA